MYLFIKQMFKSTGIIIDGKYLFIYRADYTIYDANLFYGLNRMDEYYRILRVDASSNVNDVKRAYRGLAKVSSDYHPNQTKWLKLMKHIQKL